MSRAGKTGLASGLTRCACASLELMLNLGCVVVCVKEQTIQISLLPVLIFNINLRNCMFCCACLLYDCCVFMSPPLNSKEYATKT